MPTLTLAIPTYKRFNYLINHLQSYLNSSYVSEVLVCDDCSTDYEELKKIKFENNSKLKLYTNEHNLGASQNKIKTVGLASSEWVLLLDSDNNIPDETLKILAEYNIKDPNIILMPSFAKPAFNYKQLKPELKFEDLKKMSGLESALWNTGNYLVNKSVYTKAGDLVIESKIDPGPYDVIYINYFLCKNLGVTFKIFPEFEYNHTINEGGIWLTTHTKYDTWYRDFVDNMKKE